jgi:hypothetical protein
MLSFDLNVGMFTLGSTVRDVALGILSKGC